MKKRHFIISIIMLGCLVHPHSAEARRLHHTPHQIHHGAGVDSSASYSDIVIDAETGHVIHEIDSDSLRHPASLTKMMTLYLTFQALESGRLNLGQYLTVSENASYQSPSKLGLHAGQHIRVEDAILGLVTESANDAAVVLGEALGGSEEGFGQLMTKQAHALGMTKTVFHNPSGLPDPDQVTTAHDMALLGDALVNHYPQFYPYFSHDSFTYAGIYHHNHNHLMDRYDGMDGIKTGYIRASGFNLVASAKRNGVRLIGVVFGGRSAVARDNKMAVLLDHCFAAVQAGGGRVAAADGEGDGNDTGGDDYVTLPAKVSAIFPSHGGNGVQIAQVAQAAQPQPQPDTGQDLQAAAPSPQTQPQPQQPVAQQPAAPQPAPDTQTQAQPEQKAAVPPKPLTKAEIRAARKAAQKEAQDQKAAAAKAAKEAKAQAKVQAAPKPEPKVAMLVPPANTPAPAQPSSTAGWGIQIGAYSDAAIGQQALADLTASMPDMFTSGEPQVQKVSAGGVVMYRARLMGLDKKTAQSVCSFLIQHGKSCLTVEP